jgi:hypothetical protein
LIRLLPNQWFLVTHILPWDIVMNLANQIRIALLVLACTAQSARATDAESTRELDDETRALIIKELAIMKRYGDDGSQGQNAQNSSGQRQSGTGDIVQVNERKGPRHGRGRRASSTGQASEDTSAEATSSTSQSSDCTMNVGNSNTDRKSAIRRVTTVVTGNVIQMCR